MDSQVSYSDSETVRPPSDRTFGCVFAAVFLVVGVFPVFSGGLMRNWSLVVGFIFFVLAIAFPKALSVPNRLWMRFGSAMHAVTSPIALGLVFLTTIVPIGFLLRIFRVDSLHIRSREPEQSYWVARSPDDQRSRSMKNQF